MATYSEWLNSARALYSTAMTNAYNNRANTDTTNSYYKAWQAMNSTSDLSSILPPTSTAFYGPSDGDENDILLFQGWLQGNPVVAGWLSLEPTLTFRGDQRSSLGGSGNVGSEKRRWKGNPVYTFPNGIVIGKDGQIVATIGTNGGEDLEGFGTDTIAYFDGVPFATGTGVPGSVVFKGDTVISGSIRGTGGVVIIEDVIQLETGVDSPAGIGVDNDGKIRLRHRGEGFVDLIDEINTVQTNLDNSTNTAANLAKLWQGIQNTSSARWGTSLIPNSNFSLKTVDPSDSYADRLVGVISVGTTSNIVSIPTDGVCRFQGASVGICLQAIPINSQRYAIRIRYVGGSEETMDNDLVGEGLFLAFHETSDAPEDMGDKSYIYDNSTPGVGYEGTDVYTTNVTVNYPDNTTSIDGGGNLDGVTIQQTYQVKSFVYEPTPGTQSASLVIYTKNYGDIVDIDYVVMTESPLTNTEVSGLIDTAVGDINFEVADPDISVIPDPQMKDTTKWGITGGATVLTQSTDGITGGDEAIIVSVDNTVGGGAIVSSRIQCESDRYLVGAKVRVLSSVGDIVPNVSIYTIENPDLTYSTLGGQNTSPLSYPLGNNILKSIDIVKIDANGEPDPGGVGSSVAIPIEEFETDGTTPKYTTVIGTYEATIKYVDASGNIYDAYDRDLGLTPRLPSTFSLAIAVDTECELSIDYVYGRLQGSSVNIAQEVADAAYSDAHGFVTAMNELIIKENGSIIPNASMAILGTDGKPVGWRTDLATGTLEFDNSGDYSLSIISGTGTRRLITPPFGLGTADKFSVGIRMKGYTGGIIPVISVAVLDENTLPPGYVTLADDDGSNTDVYVGGTTLSAPLTIAPTNTTDASWEVFLATWNRSSSQQTFVGGLASIIIEATDDFTVDYVFVKEQTVSYDLADAQSQTRRDEAISAAAGFVNDLGDSLAEEVGSLITNAGFTSWVTEDPGDGTPKQRPQKWIRTRDAGFPYRVIPTTEIVDNTGQMSVTDLNAARSKETVVGTSLGITGSAVKFNPGNFGGLLSAKWQLPLIDSAAVTSGNATTGVYTIAVRIRVNGFQRVGVRIYAHELFSYTNSNQTHVICEDGSYGTDTTEGESYGATLAYTFSETGGEGQIQRISIINVTNPGDTTPGYDPTPGSDGDEDLYVEYIPVDSFSSDTSPDGPVNTLISPRWYDIAGTYKPHSDAKCVSFEILVEGDSDANITIPDIFLDYVSLVVQPFDVDFASTLADARIESITGIGSAEWTGSGNTTLAAALLQAQSDIYQAQVDLLAQNELTTLIPNSFFTDSTGSTPNQWLPTRNTNASIFLETNQTNIDNAGSYGTYITLGGTNSTRGILSAAIPIYGDGDNTLGLTEGGLATNPNFDIVVRYKASSTEPISFSILAHEFYGNLTTNEYVYANGALYSYPSSFTNVERFNTGVTGTVTSINALLSDGIDTIPATSEVTNTTDWNTLVGLYQPFDDDTLPRWVSFEIVINYDQDGDTTIPAVYIDGILLQASQQTPLLLDVQSVAQAAQTAAGAAQQAANKAQADATQALSDAGDANAAIVVQQGTINQHTTSIANIELAQDELVIVSTSISGEIGSLIPNADFITTRADTQAVPAGFYPTARTSSILRIQNEVDTGNTFTNNVGKTNTTTYPVVSTSSIYYDVGQSSTAIAILARDDFAPYSKGFYTGAISLPSGQTFSYTDPSDGSTVSTTDKGVYSVAVKVKPAGTVPISVAIIANEYDSNTSPVTNGSFIKMSSNSLSVVDSYIPGVLSTWEPSVVSVQSTRSFPLTISRLSETDVTAGTWEAPVAANQWTTVGGSYTPTGTAKCVCFTIIVSFDTNDGTIDTTAESTPSTAGGPTFGITINSQTVYAMAYVDYISVIPATFSAQLAEDIAAGAAYDVQQTLEANLTALEDNLGAESDSLMPNGNFLQKFTDTSIDYVQKWLPTGSGSADKLRLYSADSASKSIGTYVKFDKNASGGSAPYGNNISGIVSKAILNPIEMVRDQQGNINAFNIGMRIRGTTDTLFTYSTTSTSDAAYSNGTAYNGSTLSTDHYSTFTAGNGTIRFDQGSVAYSNNWGSAIDSGISSGGGLDGFIAASGQGVNFPINTTFLANKSTVYIGFGFSSLSPDNSRYLYSQPYLAGSAVGNSNWKKSLWYSTDSGANWTKAQTESTLNYWLVNNSLYSNGSFENGYLVAIIFQRDPDSDTAVYNGTEFDTIRVWTSGTTGNTIISRGAYAKYQYANVETNNTPDFGLKVIAHESFEAVSNANIIVGNSSLSTNPSPATSVGVSVVNFTNGQSEPINLIDLRYSASTPASTQDPTNYWITIDADVVDNDAGEAITDWRHIVGSYVPHEDATAVSFEILVDHNIDDDGTIQEVWLDSVTMAASSVGSDLAATIADNRLFVEQNFQGGTTPVSPLNVIKNADMSQSQLVASTYRINAADDLKRPVGWYLSSASETGWDWSSTTLQISPASTSTNRAIRLTGVQGVFKGIVSAPFRITHSKYKVRVVYQKNDVTDVLNYFEIKAFCTNATLSPTAASIKNNSGSGRAAGFTHYPNVDHVNSAGSFQVQTIGSTAYTGSSTNIQTIEVDWTVTTADSTSRPGSTSLPSYASIGVFFKDDSNNGSTIDFWEISAEPFGQPYGSAALGGSVGNWGTVVYDDDGDVAPDEPRETASSVAQLNSIDIEVTDSTLGSPAVHCLLLATPRKWYTNASDTSPNVSGTSYLYPGVSDLKYIQGGSTTSSGVTYSSTRKLILPGSGTRNIVENVGEITFGAGTSSYRIWQYSGLHLGRPDEVGASIWLNNSIGGNTSRVWVENTSTYYLWNSATMTSATQGTRFSDIVSRFGFEPRIINTDTNVHSDSNLVCYIYLDKDFESEKQIGYFDSQGAYNYEFTFTGQHYNTGLEESYEPGLIVVSTGEFNHFTQVQTTKPTINEALPIVKLSTKRNEKSVWGVVSNEEDPNQTHRHLGSGMLVSLMPKNGNNKIICNSVGEGAIWVCNINGNLENGDYITSCEIPGHGMRQDDDLLHNYTVAKITQDCTFELDNPRYDCVEFEFEGQTYRKAFVGCTYHCG